MTSNTMGPQSGEHVKLGAGTETILLVDDEPSVLDVGQRLVERAGYAVWTARNGRDALDLYAAHRSDISLVILDLIMPEMGGKRCLERLFEIDPEVKVIIVSGYAENGDSTGVLPFGAKGFIGKPYNTEQMLRMIREVLDE